MYPDGAKTTGEISECLSWHSLIKKNCADCTHSRMGGEPNELRCYKLPPLSGSFPIVTEDVYCDDAFQATDEARTAAMAEYNDIVREAAKKVKEKS